MLAAAVPPAYTPGMRALVVANGEPPSRETALAAARDAAIIVAADGGGGKALALGLQLDAVVGDLDSLDEDAATSLAPGLVHHNPDVNRTDLQKAIDFCIAKGARRVDVIAAGGGRADHALANLSVIMGYRGTAEVHIVDDLFDISLVEGTATIDAPPGTIVSLVAIGQCEGVTTTGMRWDLADYPLSFSPYGVHNEVRTPPATVTVASGDLLLFRGRRVEPHI